MTIDWSRSLVAQLTFFWNAHLWPRLDGLTDEEYFWEPAAGCWSLRRDPGGGWRLDRDLTRSGPLTTIAWRMTHIAVEVLESRYRAFFEGEGPTMFAPGERILAAGELPGSAEEAVGYLDEAYTRWRDGVASLAEEELRRPLGPKGEGYAEHSMADLVLHSNLAITHHGAEICLLRDLYRVTGATSRDDRLVPDPSSNASEVSGS